MTNDQREIHRKKRIPEYAERIGNINKTCRYFGVARSTFYLWRERYWALRYPRYRDDYDLCGSVRRQIVVELVLVAGG